MRVTCAVLLSPLFVAFALPFGPALEAWWNGEHGWDVVSYALLTSLSVFLPATLFALFGVIVYGLPCYLLLRKLSRLNGRNLVIAGFCPGALIASAIYILESDGRLGSFFLAVLPL